MQRPDRQTHVSAQNVRGHPSFLPRRLEAAARPLPGRLRTMMHLAWLSRDKRVRAVAEGWHALTAVEQADTPIEELCNGGISGADLVASVGGTAWELGIPIAAFIVGESEHAVSLKDALGQVLMTGHRVSVWWPPTKWNRHRDKLMATFVLRASDEAAALRRRLRLSQAQFGSLFMSTKRTVRRWEADESDLTMHQQYFLRLFVRYIEWHGVREFRRRFVCEEPRYGQRRATPFRRDL